MERGGDPDDPAIVAAFLRRILDDREQGVERDLAHYQRQYPGHEDAIAAEFARLDGRGGASGDRSQPAETASGEVAGLVRGTVAGRYRDEQEIAVGGMGTIYRAWDPALRRVVAKKVLGTRRRGSGSTAGLLERFLDEAQLMARLDHPGIVPVHELGLDPEGRVYFTMSLVRGRTFKEVIDLVRDGREGWTRTRALGVLLRVAEAVAFAHSKGVIHRDLKPANVMVGPFGQTYVLDWGLARVHDGAVDGDPAARVDMQGAEDARTAPAGTTRRPTRQSDTESPWLTREGDVVGTPAYMAPEQARGDLRTVGPGSDVYALGAMLYHLLGGRMPYADSTTTWQETLAATLAGPPAPLRTLARDVPDELVAIQERAMARDPAQRYGSANELAEDVRAFLETRVVRAHRTGAWAELNKWVRRNRTAAAAAALALISLVLGLGASLWLRGIADANAERATVQAGIRQAVLDFLNKDLLAAVAPDAMGKDATMREVLDRAATSIEGRFPDQPLVEAAVRRTIGDTYRRLGLLDEAERHVSRSVELYSAHGGTAELLLDARRVLAIVYHHKGRLHDAERENREILALSRSAFGPQAAATLTAANNLGLVLTKLGKREEAEPLLREVYEERRETLGSDHDQTLVSMCNLGLLYYELGRYREAEPLIKGELDLCVAKHGEKNPGSLVSRNNWANLLFAVGRVDEALEQHARTFAISEEVRGERHPQTLESLVTRARLLVSIDRHEEARALIAEVQQRRGDLPPDHRVNLEADTIAAELLIEGGEIEAGIAAFEDLLARLRRVRGDRAAVTLTAWRQTAAAIHRDGRPADALRLLDEAMAAAGDGDTGERAEQLLLRGRLLAALDRLAEAEADLLAAERHFATSTAQHPRRAAVIEALVDVCERSGRPEDAAAWRARGR